MRRIVAPVLALVIFSMLKAGVVTVAVAAEDWRSTLTVDFRGEDVQLYSKVSFPTKSACEDFHNSDGFRVSLIQLAQAMLEADPHSKVLKAECL